MYWGNFKYIFIKIVKKIHSKIHLHEKVIFGQKDVVFVSSNSIGFFYYDCTLMRYLDS
jgi:hypothetical protein